MLTYNRPDMPEIPQANSYDYETVSPQLAQLITMLSNNQGSLPAPIMMAQQSQINPYNRRRVIDSYVDEPQAQAPVTGVPMEQPQRYIKPSKVNRIGNTVYRWSDYDQAWLPMSTNEIRAYQASGGIIGE